MVSFRRAKDVFCHVPSACSPLCFSLLIHYCATKTRLRLGFFLWKQKLLLWAVRAGAGFARGFSSYRAYAMVCTRRAGCEGLTWRALLLLLPSLAVSPADASALVSLAASPTVATVLVACSGCEFGGQFVVKTDTLLVCGGEQQKSGFGEISPRPLSWIGCWSFMLPRLLSLAPCETWRQRQINRFPVPA